MRIQRLAAAVLALAAGLVACNGGPKPGAIGGKISISGLDAASGIVVMLSGPTAGGAVTGADGTYRFTDVLPGNYSVSAVGLSTKEGTQLVLVPVKEGEDAKAPDLTFTGVGTITGKATHGKDTGNYGITVFTKSGQTALTDDEGNYTLSGVPVGTQDVVAVLPGYAPAQTSVAVAYNKATSADPLQLAEVSRGSGSVKGAAKFQNLDTQAGILVTLAGPAGASAITGADGKYAFTNLPAGSYTVSASAVSTKEGVRSIGVEVGAGEKTAEDLTLTALGDLKGSVVDLNNNNAGVPGVVVSIDGVGSSVTDVHGVYVLRAVPAGQQMLRFDCDRCGGNWSNAAMQAGVVYNTTTQVEPYGIHPTGAYTLTGRLMAGDKPIAGTVVTLGNGTAASSVVSGSDGVFTFSGLQMGTYGVSATVVGTVEGTQWQSGTVGSGVATVTTLPDLVFTATGEVAGKVTLTGATNHAGISVVASGAGVSALTDDAGNFVLRGVPAGSRDVYASFPGYTTVRVTATVSWGQRTTIPLQTLAKIATNSPTTAAITGKALLGAATGNAGVVVTASGPGVASATTSDTGAFTLANLPVGDYLVTLVAPSTVERVQTLKVTLASGGTAMPDVTFGALGDIKGKITLGTPTNNTGINVVVPGTDAYALTDDAGNYLLRGVPVGARTVLAAVDGFDPITASVQVVWNQQAAGPSGALTQKTSNTGSLVLQGKVQLGTATTGNGGLVVTLTGAQSRFAATADDGSYAFSALPSGDYVVSAAVPSTVERVLSVSVPGLTASKTMGALVFTPLGDVSGRVQFGTQSSGNAGIQVVAQGGSTVAFTDDSGSYTLRGVPTGSQTIAAVRAGFSGPTVSATVLYRQGVTAPNITLAAVPPISLSLSGVALLAGASASGNGGTTVTVDGTNLRAATQADGSFQLSNVADPVVTLSFANGPYKESVPGVVLSSSGRAMLLDGWLAPMPTLTLPRATRLLSDPAAQPGLVSPDNQKVAFAASTGASLVTGFGASGTPAIASLGGGQPVWAVFTSNSDRLVYQVPDPVAQSQNSGTGMSNTCSLKVLTVATGQTTTLTHTADCRGSSNGGVSFQSPTPAMAPNNAAVVFVTPMYQLAALNLATGSVVTLDPGAGGSIARMRVTPDSQAVLVQTTGGELRAAPLNASSPTISLGFAFAWDVLTTGFSPDGSRFVYGDGSGIRVLGAPWNAPLPVPGTSNFCCGPSRMTSDGRRIVTLVNGNQWVIVDAANGNTLYNGPASQVSTSSPQVAFNADNSRAFFLTSGGNLASLSTASPFATTDLGPATDFQVGATPQYVAKRVPQSSSNPPGGPVPCVVSLSSSTCLGFQSIPATALSPTSVDPDYFSSPDGTRVVAHASTGPGAGNVYVWTPGGEANLGPGATRSAILSPQGGFVAFIGSDGALKVLKMSDRSLTTVMTNVGDTVPLWVGDTGLIVAKQGAQQPLRFQNGLYFAPAP